MLLSEAEHILSPHKIPLFLAYPFYCGYFKHSSTVLTTFETLNTKNITLFILYDLKMY